MSLRPAKSASEIVPPPSRGSVKSGAFDPGLSSLRICLPFDAFAAAFCPDHGSGWMGRIAPNGIFERYLGADPMDTKPLELGCYRYANQHRAVSDFVRLTCRCILGSTETASALR